MRTCFSFCSQYFHHPWDEKAEPWALTYSDLYANDVSHNLSYFRLLVAEFAAIAVWWRGRAA